MEEKILSLFGCPIKIIIDNAQVFKYSKFNSFLQKVNIIIRHSTTYYPKGNDLAESSNKNMLRVLKKSIDENQRNWDFQPKFSLWANRVTPKQSMGKSHFEAVYGKDVVFSIQLVMPVVKLLQEYEKETSALT